MTFKEKYNSIDQSKLPENAKSYMAEFKKDSDNFTNKQAMALMMPVLDRFIKGLKDSGYGDAIKGGAKKETKKAETPKEMAKEIVEEAVEQPETKTGKPKVGKISKGDFMKIAKEIRKEGESWNSAMKRAGEIIRTQKEVVKKEATRQYEKLKKFIEKHPEVYPMDIPVQGGGFRRTTVSKDAPRVALPKGKRVSRKGWKNQYGKSEGGNKYYEYRSNRYDTRRQRYPFLAKGGEVDAIFAKGGKIEYIHKNNQRENLTFQRYNGAIGQFMWWHEKRYNWGIIYPLDNFDIKYYSHLKLKPNEVILRYRTDTMIGDVKYLVKFNLQKLLVYFMDSDKMSDDDDKNIIFQGRGLQIENMILDWDKLDPSQQMNVNYAKGGELDINKYAGAGMFADGGIVKNIKEDIKLINSRLKLLEETNTEEAYQRSEMLRVQKANLEALLLTYEDSPEYETRSIGATYYARGGYMSKGELVWNKLSTAKRHDFLHEHFHPEMTPRSIEILVNKSYNFLPKKVKIKMESVYANVEEYAGGGKTNEKLDLLENELTAAGIYVQRLLDMEKVPYLTIFAKSDPVLENNFFFINKSGKYEMGNHYWDGDSEKAHVFDNIESIMKYVRSENFKTIADKQMEGKYAKGGIYSSDDRWVVTFQNQDSGEMERVTVRANNKKSAIQIAEDESGLSGDWQYYSAEKEMANGGYIATGENYEYTNYFGIEQDDFEQIVEIWHKWENISEYSPNYGKVRDEYSSMLKSMESKYGTDKFNKVLDYIEETHLSHREEEVKSDLIDEINDMSQESFMKLCDDNGIMPNDWELFVNAMDYNNAEELLVAIRNNEYEVGEYDTDEYAKGGKVQNRYKVYIYGDSGRPTVKYANTIEEAKELSFQGEHAEIIDTTTNQMVDPFEYAKGGEIEYGSMVLKHDFPKFKRKPATTVYLKPDTSKVIKIGGLGEKGYNLLYKDGRNSNLAIKETDLDKLKNGEIIESSGAIVSLSDKYAKGGDISDVKIGDILVSSTGVKVKVVDYDSMFGGRIKAVRMDEYASRKPSQWMPVTDFKKYAKGGKIGFKGLSEKVAKYYANKSVPSKYQTLYGKKYDKVEAKEVGDKVAAKVYRQQQSKKK